MRTPRGGSARTSPTTRPNRRAAASAPACRAHCPRRALSPCHCSFSEHNAITRLHLRFRWRFQPPDSAGVVTMHAITAECLNIIVVTDCWDVPVRAHGSDERSNERGTRARGKRLGRGIRSVQYLSCRVPSHLVHSSHNFCVGHSAKIISMAHVTLERRGGRRPAPG